MSKPPAEKPYIFALLVILVISLRMYFHPSDTPHPMVQPEISDTWWTGLLSTHDWLLHGFDEGEWLGLVNAYLGGTPSEVMRPPAYPLMAALLSTIVDHRVLAMHLVGHFASVLVCLMTYALGRRLFNSTVGFWAAILLAVAPRVLMVQDEIAAFPVLVLASVCLGTASLAFVQRPRLTTGIGLGLAMTFALTAHYTSAPFVVPVLLLILLNIDRRMMRHLATAIGLAVTLTTLIYATLPASPLHSGGVSLSEFYEHALNHPDGRYMDRMPEPARTHERKNPVHKPTLLSPEGLVGRTLRRGPLAAARSMTSGYGPPQVLPLVMLLMVFGLFWPGRAEDTGRLTRWRPSLWLLCFLAPLPFAAAALEDAPNHRYLAFAVPFSALAFVRGVMCLSDFIASQFTTNLKIARLVTAIVASTVAMYSSWSLHNKRPVLRTVQLHRHALAQHIQDRFGSDGFIVGATGQMGPISAYAALTEREVCGLGSGGGTCLDSHSVRDNLAACAQAILDECHNGQDTPYVIDLLPIHHIRDPHTMGLHSILESQFELVAEQHLDRRSVRLYSLDTARLQAIARGAR